MVGKDTDPKPVWQKICRENLNWIPQINVNIELQEIWRTAWNPKEIYTRNKKRRRNELPRMGNFGLLTGNGILGVWPLLLEQEDF